MSTRLRVWLCILCAMMFCTLGGAAATFQDAWLVIPCLLSALGFVALVLPSDNAPIQESKDKPVEYIPIGKLESVTDSKRTKKR